MRGDLLLPPLAWSSRTGSGPGGTGAALMRSRTSSHECRPNNSWVGRTHCYSIGYLRLGLPPSSVLEVSPSVRSPQKDFFHGVPNASVCPTAIRCEKLSHAGSMSGFPFCTTQTLFVGPWNLWRVSHPRGGEEEHGSSDEASGSGASLRVESLRVHFSLPILATLSNRHSINHGTPAR